MAGGKVPYLAGALVTGRARFKAEHRIINAGKESTTRRPIEAVRSCGNRAVSAGVVDHGRTLLISSTKVPTTFATSGAGRELRAPTNWPT